MFIIKHSSKIINLNKFKPLKTFYRLKVKKGMSDVEKISLGKTKCYIFNKTAKNTIVFFHGGAYMNKALKFHYYFAHKIARETNSKVYFPLYPLAPEGNAQICNDAMLQFLKSIKEEQVTLMGDSAGGGLSIALAHYLSENSVNKIKKIVSICPWLDISLTNEKIDEVKKRDFILIKDELTQIGKIWQGNLAVNNPLCSPLYADIKNTPLLMINASDDILSPDIEKFCHSNKDKNIKCYEFVGLHHDFPLYNTKESEQALSLIKKFLNS
jgi:epsilon-lactone hydrolase